MADATEDFTKAVASSGEDLHHECYGWVEDKVVAKAEERSGNYVANQNSNCHTASNDCCESKDAAFVVERAGIEECNDSSAE